MDTRSAQPTDLQASAPRRRTLSDGAPERRPAPVDQEVGLAQSALAFAARCHAGQLRDSDGSRFVEHPVEVARLLRDAGCSDVVIAAGLLHDVMELANVAPEELTARFGPAVTALVQAVTDDDCVASYRERKQVLREQVRRIGGDAALLYAADKISKVREFPELMRRERARFGPGVRQARAREYVEHHQRMRLEHYQESLEMLQDVAPSHPLVQRLERELGRVDEAARG
jgi:(p)ppGpp synthase/HD superfamily hydrolase